MNSVSVTVRGQVQGVGYRWFTREVADAAGITGWVRNRHDGSVEAVLQGEPEAVDAVLRAMRKGPRGARVIEMTTSGVSDPPDPEPGFEIRPTA